MHTPGPWNHVLLKGGWDGVKAEDGTTICNLVYNEPDNASLIAAAPEMLAALELAIDRLEPLAAMNFTPEYIGAIQAMRFAINKAKETSR